MAPGAEGNVLQGHSTVRGSQHHTTSAGARRPCTALMGDASVNVMPALSLRDQSTPNSMARHRTLRRETTSASPKMPRSCIFWGYYDKTVKLVQRDRVRRHRLCRRQAPLHGASGATRPHMECPGSHRASIRLLIKWRVSELYGAQWRRRQQRCREDCVFWGLID